MKRYIYVGGATHSAGEDRSDGIHVFHMDSESGAMDEIQAVESGPNPTFLALSPDRSILFSVNETGDGAASAFRIDTTTGRLAFINRVKVGGDSPCYLSPDPSGRWLLVANYSSGSVSVLPVECGGRLGGRLQVVTHDGASSDLRRRIASMDEERTLAVIHLPGTGDPLPEGVRVDRQERPHAHCVLYDPGGLYVLAADLGQDRVWVYRQDANGRLAAATAELEWRECGRTGFDPGTGDISGQEQRVDTPRSGYSLKPGTGPRHLVFHPAGRFLYVSNELASTVIAFAWDGKTGKLRPLQELPTLPMNYTGGNDVAHLAFTPDGRFLYVSNRGHNSLAGYSVDSSSGLMVPIGHFPTLGNWPRNFCITPDGKFVLAANQESDSVVVFRLDQRTGVLEATGEMIQAFKPMFVMAVDY